MQGLFKKVCKGVVPKIPQKFSTDLHSVIRTLIQVDPKRRPSCEDILAHAIVKKKIKEYGLFEEDSYVVDENKTEATSSLLKTIYIPKNLT